MSYRCENCGEAKEGQPTIVAKGHRKAIYPVRYKEIEGKSEVIDRGGSGMEITGEMKLCDGCAKKHSKED